jgi:peroxiredoxin
MLKTKTIDMKQALFVLSLLSSAFSPQAQEKVTINASLKGLAAGTWVSCVCLWDSHKRDSVQSVADGFSMTVAVPEGEADEYLIQIEGELDGNQQRDVYLDKGTVTIKGPGPGFKGATVTGGQAIADFADYWHYLKSSGDLASRSETWKKADSLKKAHDTVGFKTLLQQIVAQEDTLRKIETIQWIGEHPNSPASAYILFSQLRRESPGKKAVIFAQLSPEAKKNASARRLEDAIEGMTVAGIGKQAPDFSEPDTAGKIMSLRDFRGKYVLIDFWASWCGPCRAENPNVVAAFSKYKGRNFTILSVSLDGKKGAWLEAIHKDGMPWTQVSDLRGWGNAAVAKYGVEGVPINFLVDPHGVIVARNLRGEELDKKLQEILQ